MLNDRIPQPQLRVKPEEIAQVLENMVLKGEVVSNKGRIYQISCFVQEDETARKIAEMLSVKPEKVNIETALESIRKNLGNCATALLCKHQTPGQSIFPESILRTAPRCCKHRCLPVFSWRLSCRAGRDEE